MGTENRLMEMLGAFARKRKGLGNPRASTECVVRMYEKSADGSQKQEECAWTGNGPDSVIFERSNGQSRCCACEQVGVEGAINEEHC